jgi:hypothetical protein
MIANVLNTVLGLWLVYLAVLDPEWTNAAWRLPLAGVAVIVLALLARRRDSRTWQGTVNVFLGALLLVLSVVDGAGMATPLVRFWGVFWPGILVAVLALWALLYRPGPGEPEDAERLAGRGEPSVP